MEKSDLPEDVRHKTGKKEISDIAVKVRYKNWKGEVAIRNIIPLEVFYGSTEYHREEQWFMRVWDLDKENFRNYALKDVQEWI